MKCFETSTAIEKGRATGPSLVLINVITKVSLGQNTLHRILTFVRYTIVV